MNDNKSGYNLPIYTSTAASGLCLLCILLLLSCSVDEEHQDAGGIGHGHGWALAVDYIMDIIIMLMPELRFFLSLNFHF